MSNWKQTGPATWTVGFLSRLRVPEDQTLIDLFNAGAPGAISNPAITVTDVDQFYTVQTDHETWEIEAAVTFTRRYDHDNQLVEGLDT